MKLKVCAAQVGVTPDLEKNFRTIEASIREASRRRADLVAFPECALSGYGPLDFDTPDDVDHLAVNRKLAALTKLISRHRIWVVLGTVTRHRGKAYNTALLFDRNGKERGRYHKLHLFTGDRRFYEPGDSLPVFKLQRQTVGLQICFDIRFPEPWRCLALAGARLIIHIANACKSATWKIPVWEGHLRSRAAENGVCVLSVNAAGPKQMGISQIIDPDGLQLAVAKMDTPGLITAQLNLSRASGGFLKQRRTDIY